mgnify:CR=1 FL=1
MRTTTSAGITYLKDKNSYPADEANEFNRLEYGDITHGSTQFIATLDDGLSFQGDSDKKAPVKLNQTLSVTGGVTNSDNLASANNIGVVSTPAGEDAQGNITENAKLQLKLAKDVNLGTDGSITAGTGRLGYNNAGTLKQTQNGTETGNFVTGLDNKDWKPAENGIVSGLAATEDQLQQVETNARNYTDTKIDTVNSRIDGQKIYDLKLNDTINVGKVTANGEEGTNGRISVNGKDGAGVTLNGEDGSITMKGKNGENTLTMKSGDHKVGVDGQDGSTRMVYHEGTKEGGVDHQVATLDDGKDTLNVKLAKDLKGLDSVEAKTVNTNTINIAKDDNHNAICRCQLQARPGQPCLHVARGHGQGN